MPAPLCVTVKGAFLHVTCRSADNKLQNLALSNGMWFHQAIDTGQYALGAGSRFF
jgi:tRNA(Phe) wybutosine-synthesizing methylase Tyw3